MLSYSNPTHIIINTLLLLITTLKAGLLGLCLSQSNCECSFITHAAVTGKVFVCVSVHREPPWLSASAGFELEPQHDREDGETERSNAAERSAAGPQQHPVSQFIYVQFYAAVIPKVVVTAFGLNQWVSTIFKTDKEDEKKQMCH